MAIMTTFDAHEMHCLNRRFRDKQGVIVINHEKNDSLDRKQSSDLKTANGFPTILALGWVAGRVAGQMGELTQRPSWGI